MKAIFFLIVGIVLFRNDFEFHFEVKDKPALRRDIADTLTIAGEAVRRFRGDYETTTTSAEALEAIIQEVRPDCIVNVGAPTAETRQRIRAIAHTAGLAYGRIEETDEETYKTIARDRRALFHRLE